ncbi:helix-turn-helix domain-containing protein [Pararhodospirillum photometricum]|uniref:Winged helix-turn-helix domain-containing protein n=1 Tax=Pararhodospirillum photometricum DSM 122 TaxID=1150469 RepID=H6SQL6_PARPM|nr:helix-turn-helix domain-containing protein [Pararhodospirillum photometricum]CCG07331.1 unnamed protein product [Pararhodospirillum photometricum DSM 122]
MSTSMDFAQPPLPRRRRQPQKDLILGHLRHVGPLTADEARAAYGVRRLAARVSELKEDGYAVARTMVDGVAVYRLEGVS